MKTIKSWLKKENIHLNLQARSELSTIRAMLEMAGEDPLVTDKRGLAQSIYDNEVLRSSHRGCSGIAFYAITDAVSAPLMIVGRFEGGIGYFSKKNEPIDLVVLLAAPEKNADDLDYSLTCVKDILCDSSFVNSIRNTNSTADIYKRFVRHCLNLARRKSSEHENNNTL